MTHEPRANKAALLRRFLAGRAVNAPRGEPGADADYFEYLAGHDIECPHCRFNLRGNRNGTCPECGRQFDRSVIAADERPHPLLGLLGSNARILLAVLAFAAGAASIGVFGPLLGAIVILGMVGLVVTPWILIRGISSVLAPDISDHARFRRAGVTLLAAALLVALILAVLAVLVFMAMAMTLFGT